VRMGSVRIINLDPVIGQHIDIIEIYWRHRCYRVFPGPQLCFGVLVLSPRHSAKRSLIVSTGLCMFVCLSVCPQKQKNCFFFGLLIDLGDFTGEDRPIGCPQNIGITIFI